MKTNFKQFIFAREYRGFTQTELAKQIPGLSQSNLSKFEKGFNTLSDETVEKVVQFLDFPARFFEQSIENTIEYPHYRIRSSVTKKLSNEIDRSIKLIGYIIDHMSDSIEWPDFDLEALNINDGFSVQTIAKHTRKKLGLKSKEPVKDIFQLLENHGIIVVELDISEKFDAVSIRTDGGAPVIIINSKFSNDRKRFTLAHELGHILLHIMGDFVIPDYRNHKIREAEANDFASEFLMPEDDIKNMLYRIRLSSLAELKRYWLTSMAAILRRAVDLNCITKERYTNLNIEMSRYGLKKDEGIPVYIDAPTLFHSGCRMHKTDLGYTTTELSGAFSLPIDVIDKFCSPKLKRGNLRLVS